METKSTHKPNRPDKMDGNVGQPVSGVVQRFSQTEMNKWVDCHGL